MESKTEARTIRILIATGLYPPDIGGPATYTVFLEKHLSVHSIAYEVLPFGVVRKYLPVVRHILYMVKLVRRARSVDYLYALDTVSVGLPVMLASMLTRTPYLLRVPGDYAWEQGQQRFGETRTLDEYIDNPKMAALPVRAFAWIQRRVAMRAKHIIVPSDYMKRIVARWGIGEEKITRVYSALKVIAVEEEKEVLRAQLGMNGFVVTTAARLTPWKGVRALIDAVMALRARGVETSLFVIGDGSERVALEEHARAVGARDIVHFLGTRTRDELARYVKASDAFVLNTSYEGLSHQLLEVMHIGTPIITTPVGGNVELITHEAEGLLVPFNDVKALTDALARIAHDPVDAEVLAGRARERVLAFHENRVIEAFVHRIRTL